MAEFMDTKVEIQKPAQEEEDTAREYSKRGEQAIIIKCKQKLKVSEETCPIPQQDPSDDNHIPIY